MRKTLFTIGYEGLDPERLTGALREAGVAVLADVRAVANSRKRGFSKNALKGGLEEAGLGYVHLRQLGTPKAGREAARADDALLLRKIYCEEVLDTADGLAAVEELAAMAERAPLCLLCFEREPERCHRRILAERLASRASPSLICSARAAHSSLRAPRSNPGIRHVRESPAALDCFAALAKTVEPVIRIDLKPP